LILLVRPSISSSLSVRSMFLIMMPRFNTADQPLGLRSLISVTLSPPLYLRGRCNLKSWVLKRRSPPFLSPLVKTARQKPHRMRGPHPRGQPPTVSHRAALDASHPLPQGQRGRGPARACC
jgi:hypothetical protein